MFIKSLPLLLSSVLFSSSLVDYGTRGDTYEIQDRSFISLIKERGNDINKSKLHSMTKEATTEMTIVHMSIPRCQKNNTREYTPSVVVPNDIILPLSGDILKKKGTYNVLGELKTPFAQYAFFVNTNDYLQLEMAKQYAASDKNNQIVFLVTDGDVKKLYGRDKEVYKATKELIDIFNIKCSPSVVVQSDEHFIIKEYELKYRN